MNPADPSDPLDAEELLFLALDAMGRQRDDSAMGYLKRGIRQSPEDARLHYLLGALLAQLHLFDRALEELALATRLAPAIPMAHLHHGLVHLAQGNLECAMAAWKPLESLPADDPLRVFESGFSLLGQGRIADAIPALRQGMALNSAVPALNRDVAQVIERLERAVPAESAHPVEQSGSAARHVLLSGYTQLEPGHDHPR